jgi:HAD superfamily hydrolase (TIGR01509 family)
MAQPIVFLDDGGVMNDNAVRGLQWQRLIGEFFTPRLGGTMDAWARANHVVATQLFEPESWRARARAASSYQEYERAYFLAWLGDMCRLVGVPVPPDQEVLSLSMEAEAYVTRRVRSAYPGAVEAIRTLKQEGYELHTASGESSATLAGYLEGMGVLDCFGRLYGPDMVDMPLKESTYYERVFADLGIEPSCAVVVDDAPHVLALAYRLGAKTVLVGTTPSSEPGITAQIACLADLPALLGSIRA